MYRYAKYTIIMVVTLTGMGCHTEQNTEKIFQAIFSFLALVSPQHVSLVSYIPIYT